MTDEQIEYLREGMKSKHRIHAIHTPFGTLYLGRLSDLYEFKVAKQQAETE